MSSAAKSSTPHSWGHILLGFSLVSIAAVAAGAMFARYLNARPLNFAPHTSRLTDTIEEALGRYSIAPESIERGEPMLERNATAVWLRHVYEVKLPPPVSTTKLAEELTKQLHLHRVAVDRKESEDGGIVLRCMFGGLEFAIVRLQNAQGAVVEKQDWRTATERLARRLETIVTEAVPGAVIERGASSSQEDARARWTFTSFEVTVSAMSELSACVEQIRQSLPGPSVAVRSEVRNSGAGALVTVAYEARQCMEINIHAEEPHSPESGAEADAADGSGTGESSGPGRGGEANGSEAPNENAPGLEATSPPDIMQPPSDIELRPETPESGGSN